MTDADEGDGSGSEPAALDHAGVWHLATSYLARYAASTPRLRRVLERQVRRWHERRALSPPQPAAAADLIDAAVSRAREIGLVDDQAFALTRAQRFVAKGLPAAEVRRRLRSERLDAEPDAVAAALDGDDASQARRFAQRKRLGPFRPSAREAHRDKDIRRLVRAGFAFRDAVAAIDGSADEE